MERRNAQQLADLLVRDTLSPACVQVVIAGSIRRQKSEIRDIEIVVQPKLTAVLNMFGDIRGHDSELDNALAYAMRGGAIEYDRKVRRDGPKYKRLWLPAHEIAVDLFIADANNWGNILAIRTGNADFSKALVTKRIYGGLMPTDMRQQDGFLWRGLTLLAAPDEAAFFATLGIAAEDIPHPTQRNADTAARLARRKVRAA